MSLKWMDEWFSLLLTFRHVSQMTDPYGSEILMMPYADMAREHANTLV